MLQQAATCLVQFMDIAGCKDEPVSLLSETFRDRETKPAGAPRNEDHAIFRAPRSSSATALIAECHSNGGNGGDSGNDGKKIRSLHMDGPVCNEIRASSV